MGLLRFWTGCADHAVQPASECLDGGVVSEHEGVVSCDAVGFPNLTEDLCLLDGVDTEVGLKLHVRLDVGGIVPGLLCNGLQKVVEHRLERGACCSWSDWRFFLNRDRCRLLGCSCRLRTWGGGFLALNDSQRALNDFGLYSTVAGDLSHPLFVLNRLDTVFGIRRALPESQGKLRPKASSESNRVVHGITTTF